MLLLLPLFACTADDDAPASAVTVELTPSEATVRPGSSTEFSGFVRGTTRWDTATCEATAGTCELHFVVAQEFRLIFHAPLDAGDVTLTLAHDGGGAGEEAAVPASASATIHVEGNPPPPPVIATAWHDGTNGGIGVHGAFAADGERFVVLDELGLAFTYDWASGATIDAFEAFDLTATDGHTVAYATDDTQVLVGQERHVVRLDPATGLETGRVELVLPGEDDLNHLLATGVLDVTCSPRASACAAVRAPAGPLCAGCPDRVSGLFLLDGTEGDTITARRIAASGAELSWTRVAWSPDGAYLAVYVAGSEIVEVRNLTGGLMGAIDTNVPDNSVRPDMLEWPSADVIVTETGTWALSTGASIGAGFSTAGGHARWRGGERSALPTGVGRFLLVEDPPVPPHRETTGLFGLITDVVLAREAPYLFATGSFSSPYVPDLYVYDVSTGARVAALPRGLDGSFDVCADGTVVFRAVDGGLALAAPPNFRPAPFAVDGETLTAPFAMLPDTDASCRFLAQTGLERSAVIDARTAAVVLELPFSARLGNAELTRFLQAGTIFAPASRVVDASGAVVLDLAGTMGQWGVEPLTGRFYGLDVDGTLRFWTWDGQSESVAISDHDDVVLPRQLWGELVFWRATGTRAGQLHLFDGGARRVMDVSLGLAPFYTVLYVPGEDLYVLAGASALRALKGDAVRARLAESPSEPYP